MKKILSAAIVAIFIFSMTGCASRKTEQTLEEFIYVYYECNRTLNVEDITGIVSAKTLLENEYDLSQLVDDSRKNLEFHYGTIINIEFSEPVITKYSESKLKYLIEDYAYLEENNDDFNAPELTEAYTVEFTTKITATEGVYEEPSIVLIVLEDGEWKVMI